VYLSDANDLDKRKKSGHGQVRRGPAFPPSSLLADTFLPMCAAGLESVLSGCYLP
jgi:hypothetical protein